MAHFERSRLQLLAEDLVTGRSFPARTPHIYAHPVISRVVEARPVEPMTVANAYPDLPQTQEHYENNVFPLRPDIPSIIA